MRAGRGTHCGDRTRMNLWELTAAELVAGYAGGKFTPRDALAEVLARITAVNPKINAIVTLDPAIFVSGGTEHQCAPGAAPIAAIVRA